ncbi:serine/threonine-protein kinase [Nocardia sp. NPDC057353]|uniref:serine/threonine-protein kinase n=1 Tax=Nocardia sp. NPDC057353 TaxID=3346104 RepID=UPI0036412B76
MQTLDSQFREVRAYWDPNLNNFLVGKRVDLSEIEDDADLVEPHVMELINHPNVVNVRAVAEIRCYPPPMRVVEVIMPYFEKGSLTDALERGVRFTPHESLNIVRRSLRGLAEMHERHGILHRDIKSPNIFLSDDVDVVKLGDLGLAGRMNAEGYAPGVNAPQLYSPPELFGSTGLTRASDIYSLGVVLLELLIGKFDYGSYSKTHVVDALSAGRIPLRPEDRVIPFWVCKRLRQVIEKSMNVSPDRRYKTAREMDTAIAQVEIANWIQKNSGTWEAPFLRDRRKWVRVTAENTRKGGVKLSIQKKTNTAWRRYGSSISVPGLQDDQVPGVFEIANNLAVN